MFRLFFKFFGLLLAVIVVAFIVQSEILDYMTSEAAKRNRADARDRFVPIFFFLERELADLPREAWPSKLEALRPGFVFPPRVAPVESMTSRTGNEKVRQRFLDGKVVFGEGDDKAMTFPIMKRVSGTDLALVMDVAAIPQIRTEAVIMNFVVEGLFVAAFILLAVMLFWRDMRKISDATEHIGRGDFGFKLDLKRGSALKPIGESLNTMRSRIADLLASHRNLTDAVSHEFRTPLTRLRFRHELACSAASDEERQRQLVAMTSAIDQLDDLSRELLEYSRMDRETPDLDATPIDSQTWLADMVEDARDLARFESRDVRVEIECGVESVHADYRYLSRAASNLLRNAVRYARGVVRIGLVEKGGRHELYVDDDGPGIPLAERDRIFEPFARLDAARDRDSGGFGIGLAIVRQIARWHGGAAIARESPLGGARVSMIW
jgi:signal transduction histidine kinase